MGCAERPICSASTEWAVAGSNRGPPACKDGRSFGSRGPGCRSTAGFRPSRVSLTALGDAGESGPIWGLTGHWCTFTRASPETKRSVRGNAVPRGRAKLRLGKVSLPGWDVPLECPKAATSGGRAGQKKRSGPGTRFPSAPRSRRWERLRVPSRLPAGALRGGPASAADAGRDPQHE